MAAAPHARFVLAACAFISLSFSLCLPATASAQRGWTGTSLDISDRVSSVLHPQSAVDDAGNVTVVWAQGEASSGYVVMAARYTATTDLWSPPVALSTGGLPGAETAVTATPGSSALAIWTTSDGVHAAWYSAITGLWGEDTTVAPRPDAGGPVVGADALGNALVLWDVDGSGRVEASRYAAAIGIWSPVVDLGAGQEPAVQVDGAGNAVALWRAGTQPPFLVLATRYSAASARWSTPATLATSDFGVSAPRVAMDGTGNATAVWRRAMGGIFSDVVEAARYASAEGTWSAPAPLNQGDAYLGPNVAVTPGGDAMAVWTLNESWGVGMFSRYAATTSTWTAPLAFAQYGRASFGYDPRIGVDRHGNAFVVGRWLHRYSVATDAWTTDRVSAESQEVVVDASGAATVVWTSMPDATGQVAVQAMRWVATPAAPTVGPVTPSAGALSIAFEAPLTTDPAFAPTNYAYSLDDGATWTTRAPASVTSPIEVAGLTSGVPYGVRLRAINVAGTGLASAAATATPGPAPGPPTNLAAFSIAGNVVTLRWSPPQNSVPPTAYVLEGGMFPGEILASIPTGDLVPTFTFVAPTGAFFVRLHALAGSLRSVASNEIPLFVNVPAPPSAPADLRGLATGQTVALSWTNTYAGGTPTGLWLEVTGALTTTLPLPRGETFSYTGVPTGTYTFRVFAASASGVSPASTGVTLTFPGSCDEVPEAPAGFLAWRVGSTLFVSWSPTAGGAAVTRYRVWVSGAWAGSFETTKRMLSGAVAPGSYVLSVQAASPCGWGPQTPPQTVVVP